MGDRGVVVIKAEKKKLYLYTHDCGELLPAWVHAALSKRERWDSAPYLARIVFCEMTRNARYETTGFGIWPEPMETEHRRPVLVIDVDRQRVLFCEDRLWHERTRCLAGWTFENFIAAKPDDLTYLFEGALKCPA